MTTNVATAITAEEFKKLSSSFVLDLIAMFSLLEEDIQKTLNKAIKESYTPEKLITEVENLI